MKKGFSLVLVLVLLFSCFQVASADPIKISTSDLSDTAPLLDTSYYGQVLRISIPFAISADQQWVYVEAPSDGTYVITYRQTDGFASVYLYVFSEMAGDSAILDQASVDSNRKTFEYKTKAGDRLYIATYSGMPTGSKVELTICFDGYHVPRDSVKTISEATCTEEGVIASQVCTVCGAVVSTSYTPALGHDINEEPTVVKKPTCTKGGLQANTCSRCNDLFNMKELAPLGHDFNEEYTVISAPTCTEDGLEARLCNRCGEKFDERVIAAAGHIPGDERIIKQSTCLEAGEKEIRCSVCGEVISTEKLELADHIPGKYEMYREPTCTTEGLMAQYCTVCGLMIGTSATPAIGHVPGAWEVVKEATTDTAGQKVKKCAVCGEILETQEIPMLELTNP